MTHILNATQKPPPTDNASLIRPTKSDTLMGGAGSDIIYGSSTGSTNKPSDANYVSPENPFTNKQSSGFNWYSVPNIRMDIGLQANAYKSI